MKNHQQIFNRIAVVQRGGCVFQKKAEIVEKAGAIGLIIVGELFLEKIYLQCLIVVSCHFSVAKITLKKS